MDDSAQSARGGEGQVRPSREGMRRFWLRSAIVVGLFMAAGSGLFAYPLFAVERTPAMSLVLGVCGGLLFVSLAAGIAIAAILARRTCLVLGEEGPVVSICGVRICRGRWDAITRIEEHTGRWSGRPLRLYLVSADGSVVTVPYVLDFAEASRAIRERAGAHIAEVHRPDPLLAVNTFTLVAWLSLAFSMGAAPYAPDALSRALFTSFAALSFGGVIVLALLRRKKLLRPEKGGETR